jgi:hypothetical protein
MHPRGRPRRLPCSRDGTTGDDRQHPPLVAGAARAAWNSAAKARAAPRPRRAETGPRKGLRAGAWGMVAAGRDAGVTLHRPVRTSR